MICLFVGNFVADFGRAAPGEPAHGRGLVHLGDGERADGVHHAADDPAASGILDVADLAIDGQQVPHLDAVLGADVNNDGAVGRNIRHHAVDLHHLNGSRGQRRRLLIQSVSHVAGRLVYGRAQNRVTEVGAPHVEPPTAGAAPASARPHDAGARARLFAVALRRGQDLGRGGVDHACCNCAHGGGLGSFHAADSVAAQHTRRPAAADGSTLIVTAELGDAADDDGIHAEDAGDLGGAGGVGAVAVGEVLLRQDLVELFAFDYGVDAVVHQLVHQDVGNAFADILIGSENRGNVALHGGVVEVHDRDTLSLLRRSGGDQRHEQCDSGNSSHRPHVPTIGQFTVSVNELGTTQRLSDLGKNIVVAVLVDADYGGPRAGRSPAVEHPEGGKAGEHTDEGHAAGRRHVLPGGVVAHVETAAGDDLREAGETAFPKSCLGAGTGDGAVHARGLFAAGAFIDHQGGSGGEEREERGVEGVGDSLGGVFADAQADGDVGGGQARGLSYWRYVRYCVGDAEGSVRPLRGQGGQVEVVGATEAAAFEEMLWFLSD